MGSDGFAHYDIWFWWFVSSFKWLVTRVVLVRLYMTRWSMTRYLWLGGCDLMVVLDRNVMELLRLSFVALGS